jgi:MFS family permease
MEELEKSVDQTALQREVEKHFRWNFTVNAIDITFFTLATNLVSQSTIIPLLVSNLTDSKLAIGLITAIYSLGFYLPQLFTANYAERMRRKKPFLVLFSGLCERPPYFLIGLVLLWLAKPAPGLTLALFAVLLAISTCTSGLLSPAWYDLIGKVIPLKYRGVWWGTGNSLGALLGVAGAALSGWLLTTFEFPRNFAYCFLAAGASLVVSYIGLAMNREPDSPVVKKSVSQRDYFKQLPEVLSRDQNFVRFLIGRSISNLGWLATGFITVYGVEKLHVSSAEVGGLTAVLVGTQAVMNLALGRLADRRGNKLVLVAGVIGAGLTSLITLLAGSAAWFWAIYVLLGFSLSAENIGSLNIILEFCNEEDRPTYIGLTNTILAPTKILAPILGGWLAGWAGYGPLFVAAVVVASLAAIVMIGWVHEPRNHPRGA